MKKNVQTFWNIGNLVLLIFEQIFQALRGLFFLINVIRGFFHGRSLPKITHNIVSKAFKMVTKGKVGWMISKSSLLKVRKFQNENLKSSHCPKYEQINLKNSALTFGNFLTFKATSLYCVYKKSTLRGPLHHQPAT